MIKISSNTSVFNLTLIRFRSDFRCDLRILSDANVFFIDTILDHLDIKDCFSHVTSNPGYVNEEGRLRISPYVDFESSPHGCSLCPPNMCKVVAVYNNC